MKNGKWKVGWRSRKDKLKQVGGLLKINPGGLLKVNMAALKGQYILYEVTNL